MVPIVRAMAAAMGMPSMPQRVESDASATAITVAVLRCSNSRTTIGLKFVSEGLRPVDVGHAVARLPVAQTDEVEPDPRNRLRCSPIVNSRIRRMISSSISVSSDRISRPYILGHASGLARTPRATASPTDSVITDVIERVAIREDARAGRSNPSLNLSELTEIELLIMRRMREFTIGEHRSLFRGSGFDFGRSARLAGGRPHVQHRLAAVLAHEFSARWSSASSSSAARRR